VTQPGVKDGLKMGVDFWGEVSLLLHTHISNFISILISKDLTLLFCGKQEKAPEEWGVMERDGLAPTLIMTTGLQRPKVP
jgi:hypothetical protein